MFGNKPGRHGECTDRQADGSFFCTYKIGKSYYSGKVRLDPTTRKIIVSKPTHEVDPSNPVSEKALKEAFDAYVQSLMPDA